jgi:HD-GYP domain-containing protein (c-di-GMP phosphodiesterase class II)
MHDIGKARVPVSILEKPGPLDAGEMEVIERHPVFGWEAIRATPGISTEILAAVRHHHEYLDGSGYPDGLAGPAIADFVRLMTIADIFGALIERRSYKAALSTDAAYQILKEMGPKLDGDLVRDFRKISEIQLKTNLPAAYPRERAGPRCDIAYVHSVALKRVFVPRYGVASPRTATSANSTTKVGQSIGIAWLE